MIKSIRLVFEILLILIIALLLSIVAEHSCITKSADGDIIYSVDGIYVCVPSSQEESFLQLNRNAVSINEEDWLD